MNDYSSPGDQVVSAFTEVVRHGMGAKTIGGYGTRIYDGEPQGEVVTMAGAPRKNISIRQALPGVTVEQVRTLDPDADLTDSADWYLIQSMIQECATRQVKAIKIPRGTYHLSRGIDLSALTSGTHIDAAGVVIKAIRPMEQMILVQHRGNWWKGRRLHISGGLEVRGDYLAQVGVKIDQVQEWHLDVIVHDCYVGVALQDTWYGGFSTSSIIQDCLVGLAFDAGRHTEVNTIDVTNLKINFAVAKSKFTESPGADSIGIRISTILGGIDFRGVVAEGMDYFVKYVPQKKGGGSIRGLVMFTGCYVEAIKKRIFDFSDYALPGYMHCYNSLIVRGSRIHVPPGVDSVFGPGEIEIIGNQRMAVRMMKNIPTRAVLRIDDNVDLVEPPTGHQIFVDRTSTVPTSVDTQRFSSWGKVGAWPEGEAMMQTVEHATYRTTPPAQLLRRTGGHSKLYPVHSITSRPTVYYPGPGDTPNGPVVRGADGGWYMILVGNGGTLTTKRVHNIARLDEGMDSRTAEQLHHMTSSEAVGVKYRCIDTDTDMILTERDGQKRWVDRAGHLAIGTTTELLAEKIPNGGRVFDVTTRQSAWSDGGALYIYDWWGEQTRDPLTSTT